MMVTVGHGLHTYDVVHGWGTLPPGWSLGPVAAVTVDADDNVYVVNRSERPVIVLSREGDYLRSWGTGRFKSVHGIAFARDGSLWLADRGDHTVKNFSTAGAHLRTLGLPDTPAPEGEPFNGPTDVAVAANGDLYVSDGYGNNRVHVFRSDGVYLKSWGDAGVGEGDFNLPHSIAIHRDGRVMVADRENHRIQVFDLDGKHLDTWTDFIQPAGLHVGRDGTVYVAELRNRVTMVDPWGRIIARWGRRPSTEPGLFVAPHAVCVDSHGDLYVGEVDDVGRIQKFARVT
ncbi:MAG: peptidyl-alpha-hydroxyglycine alpha-amidating lyase family protein [Dehalococcoidia bacterium]